jgi:hypothetical protein
VCGEDYRAEAAARSLTGDEEKVVGNGHQGSSTRALEHCLDVRDVGQKLT